MYIITYARRDFSLPDNCLEARWTWELLVRRPRVLLALVVPPALPVAPDKSEFIPGLLQSPFSSGWPDPCSPWPGHPRQCQMFGSDQRDPVSCPGGPWRDPIRFRTEYFFAMGTTVDAGYSGPSRIPHAPYFTMEKTCGLSSGQRERSLPACNYLSLGALHAKNGYCEWESGPVPPGTPLFHSI